MEQESPELQKILKRLLIYIYHLLKILTASYTYNSPKQAHRLITETHMTKTGLLSKGTFFISLYFLINIPLKYTNKESIPIKSI